MFVCKFDFLPNANYENAVTFGRQSVMFGLRDIGPERTRFLLFRVGCDWVVFGVGVLVTALHCIGSVCFFGRP